MSAWLTGSRANLARSPSGNDRKSMRSRRVSAISPSGIPTTTALCSMTWPSALRPKRFTPFSQTQANART